MVSTNYDTIVELLLFQKIEADAELAIPQIVDRGFSWREHSQGRYLEAVAISAADPDPQAARGLVSWLKRPLCGFVYINTVGNVVQQAFREDKIDYNNTCLCGHGPVRTVIVAPSMVRRSATLTC